ncbi:MAG: T9SS type A sorting domain-containing protein, partial [Flavobacteriales bacterium]
NGDGSILAISNSNGDGNAWVYQFDNGDWVQVSDVISGESGDYLGVSNRLNYDGDRLLIGAPGIGPSLTGATQVYENSVVTNVTSLNTNSNALIVYPNPAHSTLMIESKSTFNENNIISIDGSFVQAISKDLNQIDVSGLAKGVYFLRSVAENGVSYTRFVKQ